MMHVARVSFVSAFQLNPRHARSGRLAHMAQFQVPVMGRAVLDIMATCPRRRRPAAWVFARPWQVIIVPLVQPL
jgi:hypothetical protein